MNVKVRLLLRAQWDRIAGFALVLVGGVLLVFGYLGVSDARFVEDQLSYLVSGGLGGVVLVGIGISLLVSADLHDEWRKLDRIEAAIRGEQVPPADVQLPTEVGRSESSSVPGRSSPLRRAVTPGSRAVATNTAAGRSPGAMAVDWRAAGLYRMSIVAIGGLGLAWAVLFGAWAKASDTHAWESAVNSVALAIVGVGLAMAAAGSYPIRLRRRIVGRRTGLLRRWSLAESSSEGGEHGSLGSQASAASDDPVTVYVVVGQTHYHRAGCMMLSERNTTVVYVGELDVSIGPCGLCAPG